MRTRFKLGMALSAVAALGFAATQSVSAAPLTNGGFEGFPDFTGYTTTGNTTIQASDFRVPAEGAQQALISAGPGAATGGSNPVSAGSLETFLGLGAGTLTGANNAKNGSAISQTFTANAGDKVTFSYDFATMEPANGNNDFGFVTLNGVLTKLASVTDATSLPPAVTILGDNQGINAFALRETGYKSFTLTLGAGGTYTLGFGAVNVVDTDGQSGLLVDNIVVTAGGGGGGGGGVPLPAGMYLMPLGLALAGLYSAKLRRTAAC